MKKKILIYSWKRGIGDGIIESGYIREIKKMYPDSEIDLFSCPTYALSYKTNPYINKIYNLKIFRRKIIKSLVIQFLILYKLRKNKYDIVVDTNCSYQKINFRFLKIINGKKVYGYYKENNKYNYSIKDLYKIYSFLGKNNSYEAFNILKIPKYIFYMPEKSKERANIFFCRVKNNTKNVLFNPEGSHKKTLSKNKILEIFSEFSKLKNINFFINCTKQTREMIEDILKEMGYKNIFLAYEGNIFDIGALIEKMDLVVSVDTALVHMASALGVNVVGIYANSPRYIEGYPPRFVKYEIVTQKEKSKKSDDLHNFLVSELIEKVELMLE